MVGGSALHDWIVQDGAAKQTAPNRETAAMPRVINHLAQAM
jgi:hypothetical protein